MRATIRDVAKAAGVSPATVSFILNNKPVSISDATREKVRRAIDELDYHPNRLAVSLATSTTNTVGLLIPDSTNPFLANLSHKIRTSLLRDGITVITGNTDYDPSITKRYLRTFEDSRVDAIILSQLDFEDEAALAACRKILDEIDVPIISYGRNASGGRRFSTVEVDQVRIGYLATKHLLLLGHRRIGCAAGGAGLDVCSLRYQGYAQALREFGVEPDPSCVYYGSFSIEGGMEALPILLGQNVTAIFAFSDMIAYGIYKECKNYSISIPGGLSIVGVDDIPFSEIIDPPLTTVSQPMQDVADAIVDAARKSLHDSGYFVSVKLNPALKVRGSTAAR